MLFALKKYITLIVQYWKKIRSYKKKKNKINCTSCSRCIILQRISLRQNTFMREFHYLRKYLQKLTHTHMYTHTERVQTNYINTFFSSFKFQVKALETRVSKLNKLVVLLIVEHVSKLVNTVSLVYFKLCDETSNKLVRISDSRRNLVRWNFSFAKDSFPI